MNKTNFAFLSYSLLFHDVWDHFEAFSAWNQTPWNNKEHDKKAKLVSFIHRTLDFRYWKQTRKVPIQTLVNRTFVTQHRLKARVTFAYVSFTEIISSRLALGPPVGSPAPGGGGDSHMKQTGMLVVSLRVVNFGFWSRLGCSGQSANILCRQGFG